MPPNDAAPDQYAMLAVVLDVLREQSRLLVDISTGTAVTADRVGQIMAGSARVNDAVARLDAFLDRENTANSRLRAEVDAGHKAETAALTRLYTLVAKGIKSSTGQRLIQTAALALLYWLSTHGFVLPGASP